MSAEQTTLGEYIKVQGGFAFKSDDFNESGSFPVLKIKNIRFGTVDYSDTSFINEKIANEATDWCTQEGDILISMTGSGPNAPQSLVGRVARVWANEPKAWINQRVGRIILKDEKSIDKDFIYYLLTMPSSQEFLVSNSSGSANQANISGKTIESLPCPKINYIQSKSIATILRCIDQKIILNTQTNQTLESIAQAIFKSWFVDFEPVKAKMAVLADGGTREQAELAAMRAISGKSEAELAQLQQQNPEHYQQLAETARLFPSGMVESELGEIPEGWGISSIDQQYKVEMGQSPKGESYNEIGDGTLFYQGRAEFGTRFPTPRLFTTEPKKFASQGDILMSVRAPVGDLNIANNSCCIGRGLAALNHNLGGTSFAYYELKSLHHIFDRFNGEGTVFGSINQKDLKSISVVTSSPEIISQFRKSVEKIDAQIYINFSQNVSLAELRDSLLPKLLSGEIDLSDIQSEVA